MAGGQPRCVDDIAGCRPRKGSITDIDEGQQGREVQLAQTQINDAGVIHINGIIGIGVLVAVPLVQAENPQVGFATGKTSLSAGVAFTVDNPNVESLAPNIHAPQTIDVLELQRPGGVSGGLATVLDQFQIDINGISHLKEQISHRAIDGHRIEDHLPPEAIGHGDNVIITGRHDQAYPPQLGAKGIVPAQFQARKMGLGLSLV